MLWLLRFGIPFSFLFAAGCGPTEAHVREELDAANHCAVASECVDVGTECPFGCNILVHASEATEMRQLLEDWHAAQRGSACMYDCVAPTKVQCVAGKCQMAP